MRVIALVSFVIVTWVYAKGLRDAIASIRHPDERIWPPPEDRYRSPLRVRLHSLVTALGVPVVGLLDWNSFVFESPLRFVVATALICVGLFGGRAHRHLGTDESVGQPPPGGRLTLRTDGPYAITRNPQYAAAIPGYLGIAIGTNSILALIAAAVMGCSLFAMVIAEEAWLRERFGEEYADYCRKVPRFVPRALNPFR